MFKPVILIVNCSLLLILLNGCEPAPGNFKKSTKASTKASTKISPWKAASPEAEVKAKAVAMAEAKRQLALYYYGVANEEGMDAFKAKDSLQKGIETAWEKSDKKIKKSDKSWGIIQLTLKYKFKVSKFNKDGRIRKIVGPLPGRPAERYAALNNSKRVLRDIIASNIAKVKVSENQTVADFVASHDNKLRESLAIYLFKLNNDIKNMGSLGLKASFSQMGSFIDSKDSMYWTRSGYLPVNGLLQDLAAIMQPYGGPSFDDLKKYNKDLPEKTLLETGKVKAPADYDKLPLHSDFSPKGVFAPAFESLNYAFKNVK
jgi:hypothetical protein